MRKPTRLHKCLGYAVREKRLAAYPLSKANLPEGWTAPAKPDDTLDPRAVGSPELVASMLTDCGTVGRRQGPRFVVFYGCMFYALMRPSEVAALTTAGCHLLAGQPAKSRFPPQLVALLRDHILAYGTAPDGRLFRSENGTPLQPSTWWQVGQKVRAASLTPEQLATPLMKKPYDLRHSGTTWRLDSGVPDAQVAAWAGHSVEMLRRVYAGRAEGLEGIWITRMDQPLPQDEP